MTAWNIYWLTRLEPLSNALATMAFLIALTAVAAAVFFGISRPELEGEDYNTSIHEDFKLAFKVFIIGAVPAAFIRMATVFIPTKSDLAIIFAAEWATNSEEMKRLPDNVIATINKFMDGYREKEK